MKIRRLEWQEPCSKNNYCWTAETIFGTYSVVNEDGWSGVLDNFYELRFCYDAPRDGSKEDVQRKVEEDYITRANQVIETPWFPNKESNSFKELHDLIDAWEFLKGGKNVPVRDVEKWLVETMGPAINKAREFLGREIPK